MTTKPKKVAVYLRVSTIDQNCEMQRSELNNFILARGWKIFDFYEDNASGTQNNRPALSKMLQDARSRKFDILICWKLDRLFRSLKGVVTTLQNLAELNIEFISLRDQIDMSTASGRLMMHIIAAFAEFEAALIKERVRAGLALAKQKGMRLGRPQMIDSQVVSKLRDEGLSLQKIADRIGASKAGVYKTLRKMRSSK